MAPRDYDPSDFDAASVKLDRFMKAATDQLGTKYQFGAEASFDDPHPQAFDSSELVEWAAHQAGMPGMPDGSWNQYRYLHDQGATVSFDEAMHTRGALVFGFSSDPLESTDRPAHAYVGISLGNGKILDISERSGQVKVMDPGGFYSYGAKIPEFHAPDDTMPPDDPFAPSPYEPAKSYAPDGHIIHEDLPAPTDPVYIPGAGPSQPPADATTTPPDASPMTTPTASPTTPAPSEPQVSTTDDPQDLVSSPGDDQPAAPQASFPDNPEDDVCYPGDDNIGPLSVDERGDGASTGLAYGDDATSYDTSDAYAGAVGASDTYAADTSATDSYAADTSATDSYGSDAYAANDAGGGDLAYASDGTGTDSYASDDSSYSDMSTSDV